jgi:hypothetical protein
MGHHLRSLEVVKGVLAQGWVPLEILWMARTEQNVRVCKVWHGFQSPSCFQDSPLRNYSLKIQNLSLFHT